RSPSARITLDAPDDHERQRADLMTDSLPDPVLPAHSPGRALSPYRSAAGIYVEDRGLVVHIQVVRPDVHHTAVAEEVAVFSETYAVAVERQLAFGRPDLLPGREDPRCGLATGQRVAGRRCSQREGAPRRVGELVEHLDLVTGCEAGSGG